MAEGDQFFLTSSTTGERVELTGDTSVGRSDDSDLVVSEGQPSRAHAKITIENSVVHVEDLNSTNGTFLNGTKLSGKHQLSDGDEVAFDVNKFVLEVQSQQASDATVIRPVDPGATVLRPIIDEEAEEAEAPVAAEAPPPTEPVEAPPAAEAPPVEPPPAPEPVVEPTPEPVPEPVVAQAPAEPAKPKAVKPGSWADPNEKNASSTQFFSPADLAAMRGGSVAEKVESDVPYLQVSSGAAAGSVIQLIAEGATKEWSIGCDESRDIVFKDQGVSEFHTLLVHESGRWKLVDQMSTNGTFINDSKTITGYLNSGDKIRIGTVTCAFVLPGAVATKAGSASSSGKSVWISVAAFVGVLAVLFGAYFLL
jgi:pSer/pThr/pTyr-binding forkhead associated (FHA) protein